MPQLDKTGPMGQGAQTGRKKGKCSEETDASVETATRRRGMGRGFRQGANQDAEFAMGGRRGKSAGRGKGRRRGMGFGRNSEIKE